MGNVGNLELVPPPPTNRYFLSASGAALLSRLTSPFWTILSEFIWPRIGIRGGKQHLPRQRPQYSGRRDKANANPLVKPSRSRLQRGGSGGNFGICVYNLHQPHHPRPPLLRLNNAGDLLRRTLDTANNRALVFILAIIIIALCSKQASRNKARKKINKQKKSFLSCFKLRLLPIGWYETRLTIGQRTLRCPIGWFKSRLPIDQCKLRLPFGCIESRLPNGSCVSRLPTGCFKIKTSYVQGLLWVNANWGFLLATSNWDFLLARINGSFLLSVKSQNFLLARMKQGFLLAVSNRGFLLAQTKYAKTYTQMLSPVLQSLFFSPPLTKHVKTNQQSAKCV